MSLYTIANINFRDTMAARSGGISIVFVTEETTDPHDFPMIFFVMLSKQNILASAVPSEAMKVNLYMQKAPNRFIKSSSIYCHNQYNINAIRT
jgi:hypothetical protein